MRIRSRSRSSPSCPLCREPVEVSEARECEVCGAPQHPACVAELGGCHAEGEPPPVRSRRGRRVRRRNRRNRRTRREEPAETSGAEAPPTPRLRAGVLGSTASLALAGGIKVLATSGGEVALLFVFGLSMSAFGVYQCARGIVTGTISSMEKHARPVSYTERPATFVFSFGLWALLGVFCLVLSAVLLFGPGEPAAQ